jgi:hypothetical protein
LSPNKIGTAKKIIFSGIILLTLVLGMEFTLRVKYALDDGNWKILIAPFGGPEGKSRIENTDGPLDFRYSTEKSYSYFNTHEKKNYTVNITNQGFFYHSLLEREDTTTFRIFCIGGSSTFGGQAYEETWPGYLEKCLRGKYEDRTVEVVNFGQPGVGLLEILAKFKQQALEYHPDLIIYYGAYNDADKIDCLKSERLGRRLIKGIQPNSNTLPLLVNIHKLLHRRWSYLYTYLLEKYELIKYTKSIGYVDIEGYGALLDDLLEVSRKHEIDLVFVSQVLDQPDYPVEYAGIAYDDSTTSTKFYQDFFGNNTGDHEVWVTFRQRTLIKLQKEFCNKNGLRYIDLRNEFKNSNQGDLDRFYDIVHLSSRGNYLLASIICRELNF